MVLATMVSRILVIAALLAPLATMAPASRAADIGIASFYGREHVGKKTASGKRFDLNAMTAAHRTLPFGTRIVVTNLKNGRSVTVEISDRGPFRRGRIVDVSYAAAEQLGFLRQGVTRVSVEEVQEEQAHLARTVPD
jgi:rare lipoprotein A